MTTEQEQGTPFARWAILELMGHRRLAGFVAEETIAGVAFLRIDVPAVDDDPAVSQWYSPSAVYAITPCSEDTARRAAGVGRVKPVHEWELQPARIGAPADGSFDDPAFD